MGGQTEEIETTIAPACARLAVEVVDVEVRPGTLTVTIERPGAALDLEALAACSRAISDALDDDPRLGLEESYELEVTSPGLERRLRRPAHFARALGALVSLRTVAGTPGERRLEGRLVSADETGVDLDVEGRRLRVGYEEIERARTVFDWAGALSAAKAERPPAAKGRRPASTGGRAARASALAATRRRTDASGTTKEPGGEEMEEGS